MCLVISHRTARLFYQTVERPEYLQVAPADLSGPEELGPPTRPLLERARTFLVSSGVPKSELQTIDVLVTRPSDRRSREGLRCHMFGGAISHGALRCIGMDIYVVSPELCALQAAEQLTFRECVEYFFELCGAYRLSFEEGNYAECRPATSAQTLRDYFASPAHARLRGIRRAQRAARYVRDGARSPMETALAMMLVMPKSEGGLGIRDVELDYHVPVSGYASKLTQSHWFFGDIFIRRARLIIEYNGWMHDSAERTALDNERVNALRALGYEVITVSKKNFLNRGGFERMMAAICRYAGVRPARLPEGFSEKQEQLRRFVLRRQLASGEQTTARGRGEDELAAQHEQAFQGGYWPFEPSVDEQALDSEYWPFESSEDEFRFEAP